jgi:hypothetical protein
MEFRKAKRKENASNLGYIQIITSQLPLTNFSFRFSYSSIVIMILAGTPLTTTLEGTSLVTTLPATTEFSPTVTFGNIVTLPPIMALS